MLQRQDSFSGPFVRIPVQLNGGTPSPERKENGNKNEPLVNGQIASSEEKQSTKMEGGNNAKIMANGRWIILRLKPNSFPPKVKQSHCPCRWPQIGQSLLLWSNVRHHQKRIRHLRQFRHHPMIRQIPSIRQAANPQSLWPPPHVDGAVRMPRPLRHRSFRMCQRGMQMGGRGHLPSAADWAHHWAVYCRQLVVVEVWRHKMLVFLNPNRIFSIKTQFWEGKKNFKYLRKL
jgi:hypothetical protein